MAGVLFGYFYLNGYKYSIETLQNPPSGNLAGTEPVQVTKAN